jgi:hypothetical protein
MMLLSLRRIIHLNDREQKLPIAAEQYLVA